MAKQLIVSVNGREKKIAIIEDDKVSEFYIERGEQHQGIVGNIYKGRVMRVLPGMQSAFVDIGLERDAFLYVSDFFDEEAPATPPSAPRFEIPDTPFVAGDPSIERIIDEEETAANGEMFKDARLQERLFDQIHAVEFNMEDDDFRSAEVGSLLSSGLGGASFERIDDGE